MCRFNPAGMKAEYLWTGVDEDEDDEDLFDELSGYVALLAAFYRIAADRGDAVRSAWSDPGWRAGRLGAAADSAPGR